MSGAIGPFAARYRKALADSRLGRNLLTFQRAWRTSRDAAFRRLADETPALGAATTTFEAARQRVVAAKNAVLADPGAARRAFLEKARAAGLVVHEVETPEAARETILGLLEDRGARLLAKGKSMVAEEIFLNAHLEQAGLRVVETDLGEWIVQLSHETPSHMVMPAIHKSRQQIGALFEAETGRAVSHEDVKAQVNLAREELRRAFLAADAGMIGANALIAETGTVMLITNEGNGDLVSSVPPFRIVIAGWEKLVPTFADAAAQVRLLARSATGQEITTYTTFVTGAEPDRETHLVLLDNGRSAMWADLRFRDALRCIRCAACADVCPPYQVVGGHVFGYVYSGAIGLVNTAFHHGLDAAAGPQSLCVSCNACATVCPVAIPLPRQILDVRARVVAAKGLPITQRLAFAVWSRPRLFDAVMRAAAWLARPFARGPFLRLPLPERHAWRTAPAPATRPARDGLLGRVFEPVQDGPWSASGARGLTVAYFVQCLTDRFAPEQADAAIRVLAACGARVVVPAGQHCCGLPLLDAGDPAGARRMAKATIETLEAVAADYVVSAAASCAIAILHDYAHLFEDEPEWRARAERLASRTLDLVSFLDRVANPPALPPSPGAGAATYHGFCQSTNVLGLGQAGARLLRRAGLAVTDLPEGEVCCGFGASASVLHPEVARGIAGRKLANVRETEAACLATDNPGCLLHMRGAADAAGMRLEVRHLAELLADRLPGDVRARARSSSPTTSSSSGWAKSAK